MNTATVLRTTADHTHPVLTGATLVTIAAAILASIWTPSFLPVLYLFTVGVMAVNLFHAVTTYYDEDLSRFLDTVPVNPWIRVMFFFAAAAAFTMVIYISPVFAVAILGFLGGAAAIAFIDAVGRHLAGLTQARDADWVMPRVFTVLFLLAGWSAVLGRSYLGIVPGFADAFFLGGLAAVTLLVTFLAATVLWTPGTPVFGVELVEAGTYVSWFLAVGLGYVTYAVTATSYMGAVHLVPWTAAAAIFLFVFAVVSAALKRFGTASLPMVNPENLGYIFLYFLSALTVIWLSTELYSLTMTTVIELARTALLVGAVVGIPHALYKKYWLLENRDPWFRATQTHRSTEATNHERV